MDDQQAVATCVSATLTFVFASSRTHTSMKRSRLARYRRRRTFAEKQARQRLLFSFTLSMLAFNCFGIHPRSIWMKERSSVWWDHLVNGVFTDSDWITNFCMSRGTFMYVCNQIRHLIEKKDNYNATPYIC